jgi:quinol monooxygenase YgiN
LDDFAAVDAARELAVKESDPHAKEVFESQATFANSLASEEMKSVILTIDHIIELSETNGAIKISHAEEIKVVAFEQYNEAQAKLKKMNEGAGRYNEAQAKLKKMNEGAGRVYHSSYNCARNFHSP